MKPTDDSLPDPARYPKLADGLRALEARRIQALLHAQGAVLLRLHAPHYQLITPSGTTFTRDRYLGFLATGTLRYLRWDAQDMAVLASPEMAVVRYRVTLQLGSPEEPGTPFEAWHTDVYERLHSEHGRQWQAVWSQATQVKT